MEALELALEWLVSRTVAGQRCLICSDSKAALAALDSGSPGVGSNLSYVRQLLGQVRSTVLLQWVPGHCGLLGNEWADQAAKEAAADRAGEPRPVSWAAAKALIDRAIVDPPPEHPRVGMVYGGGRPDLLTSRKANVMVARLRSGHSTILAAYRHRIGQGDDPSCQRCGAPVEDLEHWLSQCPASLGHRMSCFGVAVPPLSSLGDSRAVASYLRGLRLL